MDGIASIVIGLESEIGLLKSELELFKSKLELLTSENSSLKAANRSLHEENLQLKEQLGLTSKTSSIRKKTRDFDKNYYKNRNVVERFFARLKQFRGIATRYCKRGKYFLEAIKFVASIILIT